jgi:multidrug efflux pump subunit AcrA (membrane-fusion protein)
MMMIKRFALAGAAVGVAAVGVLAMAGSASASAPSGVITQPTTSYSSPSNQSAPVRSLAQGTPVQAICFTEGQTLKDNHYWFRVVDDGSTGYVHRSAISVTPDLRHC